MMKSNLKNFPQKLDSDDEEFVKELMKDPVVLAKCKEFDEQGIAYQIIPIRMNKLSN